MDYRPSPKHRKFHWGCLPGVKLNFRRYALVFAMVLCAVTFPSQSNASGLLPDGATSEDTADLTESPEDGIADLSGEDVDNALSFAGADPGAGEAIVNQAQVQQTISALEAAGYSVSEIANLSPEQIATELGDQGIQFAVGLAGDALQGLADRVSQNATYQALQDTLGTSAADFLNYAPEELQLAAAELGITLDSDQIAALADIAGSEAAFQLVGGLDLAPDRLAGLTETELASLLSGGGITGLSADALTADALSSILGVLNTIGELGTLPVDTEILGISAIEFGEIISSLFGFGPCTCDICEGVICACTIPLHELFRQVHAPIEYEEHRRLLIEDLWYGNILPAMMRMTEQISVMALMQMQMVGAMLDAKHQLETQQLFRELHAQAHKDYRPSTGMCEIGTVMKSVHASFRRSDWSKIVLIDRAIKRHLGTVGTAAAEGRESDIPARLDQYINTHCSPRDFNRGTRALCADTGTPTWRRNRDIDWPRTVSEANTLDIDFTVQGAATPDEADVFALSAYLYGHEVFTRIPRTYIERTANEENNRANLQQLYMDMRAIIAKRQVAENSFANIVANKASGTGGSIDYIYALIEELGIAAEEIPGIIGENPSYDAQLKMLTEIMNYNPDVYVNLYDSPNNILRKRVSTQAIGILQKWETLETMWRTEMVSAVAAEMLLEDLQEDVQDELNTAEGTD